ncbi:MAG: gliding motility-associated C-terminal domain-containing protein [Saprospiraceae bacterium]|nr:gliding motility-associated C-terminal domain-containing protein [Saprospiraceae bacterium]MBK9221636.1 gliding motility-associated C-terminal domain-containing protein [Saprospiraceae bacterium]
MKIFLNKCTNLFLTILFLVCIYSPKAHASHIVGGEMSYKCLGGQVYEITLTLRRDCFNGSPEAEFDDPAHIGIFDTEGNPARNVGQFGLLLLDFRNDDTLNEILRTECEVVGGDVCVHTTTYRGKIELAFAKGGYTLAYQRCCRNKTITNISDPELIGATYSVVISEDALRYCNSSPRFGAFPPIYVCGDRVISFDNSAKDPDGDSLVYSLCVPFAGADTSNSKPTRPSKPPFPLVNYKSPFSLNDLLGGTPTLKIDKTTGLLTGQPNAIGQYLVGICVDEYRNGRLLSRVRRDFQYNVRFCTTNPVSNFDADNSVLCKGDSTVKFTNNSINSKAYTWYFDYPNTNYTSIDTNPVFTFPKPGKYTVALIAVRAKDCIDTNYKNIFIYDENLLGSDFDANYGSCDDSIEISFKDKSFDSLLNISNWNWFIQLNNNIVTSTKQDPKFTFSDTGTLSVRLIVTSSGGCTDSLDKEFKLNRLKPMFLSEKIPICIGESTKLISNPDGRFKYNWSPSADLSCNDCPDPIANPANDILYKVTITDGNCTEEDSILVTVSRLLDIDIKGDSVICADEVNLSAIGGVESTIEWSDVADFGNILKSGSFLFNTTIQSKKTFYVRAKSNANCPGSDSISVENQKVIFQTTIDSLVVCEDDTFELELNNLRPEHQFQIEWSPVSSILSGQSTNKISAIFPDCGINQFHVKIENQYKCTGEDSVQVRVICKPTVDFKVDKNCDNTLVTFSNLSSNGNYYWDFGDSTSATDKSPVHLYAKPGRYTVSLGVNAECKNAISKIVDVGFIMVSLKERVVSCLGTPVKLNENPDTTYTYEWSPANGLDNPNSQNPTASVTETTIYKVRVFDKNIPDCFIDRTVTVFVPPTINLSVNNDTILCNPGKIILQAATDVTANIEWTDQIGILLGRGYQLEQQFIDSMYVYAFATDQYGCGEKDSFRVVPLDTNYIVRGKVNLCPGADGFIEFINNDGHQYALNWTPGRFIVSDPTLSRILVKPTDTTIFYLSIVNEYGCAFKDSFQVNISRFNPPLEAFAEDDTIYLGQSTVLHVNLGYSNYNWVIPYNLSCTDCTDPVASPLFSTLYTVKAKNEDGCEDQADVRVIVIRPNCDDTDVFMPNVFSPNNDKENDVLEIRSNFLESVELYIYDRWGEKVFETKDKSMWWDGSYKGVDLPPDVYGYYFRVVCVDGKKFSKKGNVTLIK